MSIEHKPLIEYLPPFLAEYREYRRTMDVMWWEISEKDGSILERIDNALKDTFIEDATLSGIRHWEKILNITPLAGSTLEERRRTVAAIWAGTNPLDRDGIREIVAAYTGHDADVFWSSLDVLTIDFDNTDTHDVQLSALYNILRKRLPANATFNIRPSCTAGIGVSETVKKWPVRFDITGTLPKTSTGLGKSGDQLAHTASAAGWVVEHRMCGEDAIFDT